MKLDPVARLRQPHVDPSGLRFALGAGVSDLIHLRFASDVSEAGLAERSRFPEVAARNEDSKAQLSPGANSDSSCPTESSNRPVEHSPAASEAGRKNAEALPQ